MVSEIRSRRGVTPGHKADARAGLDREIKNPAVGAAEHHAGIGDRLVQPALERGAAFGIVMPDKAVIGEILGRVRKPEAVDIALRGIQPDLSGLRMIARAITPPQRPRRFDTRFLAVWADAIADRLPDGTGPSGELEDCAWLTFEEARQKDLPMITNKILTDLEDRLAKDPELSPTTPVPYYFFRKGGFVKQEL